MGEYADDYFRREVMGKFGFDPGPNDKGAKLTTKKVHCPKCGRRVKEIGLKDHLRTVHKIIDRAAMAAAEGETK
jgi:hypothetical protein